MHKTTFDEALRSEAGFTLAEILVAVAILSIAFLGLGSALSVQGGLASRVTNGHAAVARSYSATTATMLAQQRIEQVKRLTYTLTTDQMEAPTPAGFSDEDFGIISGYPDFRREVRVQNYPAESMKTITVTVAYRVVSVTGTRTEALALSTLVAARP
jgi:prepilin-type N-terminal cleavage/methylation domain-containing protein